MAALAVRGGLSAAHDLAQVASDAGNLIFAEPLVGVLAGSAGGTGCGYTPVSFEAMIKRLDEPAGFTYLHTCDRGRSSKGARRFFGLRE